MLNLRSLLVVVLLFGCAGPPSAPPSIDSASGATPPSVAASNAKSVEPASHPFDDGPYLFEREGGSIEAVWVRGGEKRARTFARGEAVRLPEFRSLLGDSISPSSHEPPPCVVPMPARLFAVTDVEGQYADLVRMLQGAGVIDTELRWSYGAGHLVTIGDMVDRGDQVTEVLWLMYRLSREALEAGGRVHFVLGNHESMVLGGDVRYVAKKYDGVCEILGMSYSELLGPDTELGRWLRAQNSIVRVGELLFVHAGISPELEVTAETLSEVNDTIRRGLGVPYRDLGRSDPEAAELIRGRHGPHWYRGFFPREEPDTLEKYGPRPTEAELDTILAKLGARTIVVGHTKVRVPHYLYEGKQVLALDVPWTRPAEVFGLRIEGEKFELVDIDGSVWGPSPVR